MVQIKDSSGETLFQVGIGTAITIIIGIITVIGLWNTYLHYTQVSMKEITAQNCTEIALLKQTDTNHLTVVQEMKADIKALLATVGEVRDDQIRRKALERKALRDER